VISPDEIPQRLTTLRAQILPTHLRGRRGARQDGGREPKDLKDGAR
jgi:hypothetical protein